MPVPFEALLPFGIMIGMFTIAGGGLAATKTLSNEGKTHRHGLDIWERQMMERDRRLTGTIRGQTAETKAPDAFAVNSTWKIERFTNVTISHYKIDRIAERKQRLPES